MKLFRLDKLFDFLPKSKIKAGDGKVSGEFPLYTSSPKLTKYYDEPIYDIEGLVFGTGGLPSVHFVENKFSTSTDCIVIKRKGENILTKYVYYYLFGNIQILEQGFKGAGLKHISKKYIQEIKVPVPDLQTQEQTISILDKAQGLIQKREHSLSLLDKLLRATFLDMFGDPVINDKKWEIRKLGKISKLARGKFSPRPRNDPSYFNGNYPFIQTGDISKSDNRLNSYSQTLNDKGIKVSKEFKKDTIVIAIVGATIGATAILDIDVYATDSIIGITAKSEQIHPYFLEYVLRFWKPVLLATAPSAARANINLSILDKQDIITPSISEQHKFVTFFNKVEVQKNLIQNSSKEANNLFQSLLQEAFTGNLKIKDNKLGLQSALDKVKWFEEQIKQITSNTAIEKLQKQMEAFNKISEPFDKITKLQKQLDKLKIPNLDKIDAFQKSLEKFNIPQLKNITRSEDFLKLTQDNFLKEIGEKQAFEIKGLENIAEKEKQKEIKEELKIENDPVLQFIGSEQIGKFTVDNYKINVARAIHKFFGKREFDIDSLVEALKNEKGIINVRKAAVKKDLFKIFKEFIIKKHYGMFSFERMRQSMKKHLFNPSFELLQEFIDSEMELKSEDKLSQVYFDDLHKNPSDPYYNDKSLFEKNRTFQLYEERIYLQYKIKADED